MHLDGFAMQSAGQAMLISTGSGFAEHPDDTFVGYSARGSAADLGGGASAALPHSSGSIDSDDDSQAHIRDFPVGTLRHEGSLQRDASMPSSALNPNYEYELPKSLALVAPEPEDEPDEMLKPSLFDREAGGYRAPRPDPPGVVAAAATAAASRRDRHAATVADVPSESLRGDAAERGVRAPAADQPLIDLSSTGNMSGGDASGSQAGRSGAGSIGHTPSLASGASAVGNYTAPALGAYREPSLQARSSGVTGSTVVRSPYGDTIDSNRTRVYVPHTQSTHGRQTEGRSTRERTVDGTIEEDAVYEEPSASGAAAALQAREQERAREIAAGAGRRGVYSTLAPAGDVGLETTDATVSETGIRAVLKQLDVFTKKDLFLGKFELLGRQQRRRGGALP